MPDMASLANQVETRRRGELDGQGLRAVVSRVPAPRPFRPSTPPPPSRPPPSVFRPSIARRRPSASPRRRWPPRRRPRSPRVQLITGWPALSRSNACASHAPTHRNPRHPRAPRAPAPAPSRPRRPRRVRPRMGRQPPRPPPPLEVGQLLPVLLHLRRPPRHARRLPGGECPYAPPVP